MERLSCGRISVRLADSLETALHLSGGLVVIDAADGEERSFPRTTPRRLRNHYEDSTPACSPSQPLRRLPVCDGLLPMMIDPELMIPTQQILNEGA